MDDRVHFLLAVMPRASRLPSKFYLIRKPGGYSLESHHSSAENPTTSRVILSDVEQVRVLLTAILYR